MELREFTRSGAFVATVFLLVVGLAPFGLEEIGDTTGLFAFPATKTVKRWLGASASAGRGGAAARPVDWERYRQELETFSLWAEERRSLAVSLPRDPEPAPPPPPPPKPERRVWPVPVASCTAGDPSVRKKGYAYISGFDRVFTEGSMVAPSDELCGYEIACIGERTVWFRAVFEDESDIPTGAVRLPEFTRVEGETLVWGNRRHRVGDEFSIAAGESLRIDSFLPPDGVVFKLYGKNRQTADTLLCVVIGVKGGR